MAPCRSNRTGSLELPSSRDRESLLSGASIVSSIEAAGEWSGGMAVEQFGYLRAVAAGRIRELQAAIFFNEKRNVLCPS